MEEKIYASELSGHCNELTAWQIIKEVSGSLIQEGLRPIDPYCIEICDDAHFSLTVDPANHDGFDAPETTENQLVETGVVWSLGATVFFIVMGHQVMNGRGGKTQKESSKLPYMRGEWPDLSELVQSCLQFNPALRPSLVQIHDKAERQHRRCMDEIRKGPRFRITAKTTHVETLFVDQDLAFWPETMQTTISNP